MMILSTILDLRRDDARSHVDRDADGFVLSFSRTIDRPTDGGSGGICEHINVCMSREQFEALRAAMGELLSASSPSETPATEDKFNA